MFTNKNRKYNLIIRIFSLDSNNGDPDQKANMKLSVRSLQCSHTQPERLRIDACDGVCHNLSFFLCKRKSYIIYVIYMMYAMMHAILCRLVRCNQNVMDTSTPRHWSEILVFMLTTNGADQKQWASISSQFQVCSLCPFSVYAIYIYIYIYGIFFVYMHVYIGNTTCIVCT